MSSIRMPESCQQHGRLDWGCWGCMASLSAGCAHGMKGPYGFFFGSDRCPQCIERMRWERDMRRLEYQRDCEDLEITAAARAYCERIGIHPVWVREALA